MNYNTVMLINVQRDFCHPESDTPVDGSETPADDSVAVVVECATKVTDVTKSSQKKH